MQKPNIRYDRDIKHHSKLQDCTATKQNVDEGMK